MKARGKEIERHRDWQSRKAAEGAAGAVWSRSQAPSRVVLCLRQMVTK